jgi:hypothetical protein
LKKNSGIKLLIGQEVLRKHPGIQLDFKPSLLKINRNAVVLIGLNN